MISLGFLFEEENKKSTKLHIGEKIAGGLGIAGGTGLWALSKKLQEPENQITVDQQNLMSPDIYKAYQKHLGQAETAGLATAGTIAGALAAHKLYKMYKNKKNKEI